MGKESYSSWSNGSNSNNGNKGNSNLPKVGYFSLKNGEDATVRFCYDSVDQIEILSTHTIKNSEYVYGKTVYCLRDGSDPIDKCPLCNSGNPIVNKFYVKLLQYVPVEGGKVEVQPKIWERNAGYAKVIADYIRTYGLNGKTLKDYVFKIVREGTKLDTTYRIVPCPSEIYTEKDYPKYFSYLEKFDVTRYIGRSYEDLEEFVRTKKLPDKFAKKNETKSVPDTVEKVTQTVYVSKESGEVWTPQEVTPRTTQPSVNTTTTDQPDFGGYNSKSDQRRVTYMEQPKEQKEQPTNRPTRWY